MEDFSRIGRRCAQLVTDQIRTSKLDLNPDDRMLDFGCGCGRTARWILAEFPNLKLHGVDVDPKAIAWCTAHLPSSSFLVNGPLPPLPYPDAYFRVVYRISVFTHLNEHYQGLWLAELRRIVQPGGLLILTVHGGNATTALSAPDRARLAENGFLHKTSTKMRGLMPEWYHTTWHTRDYILARLSTWCKETSYIEIKDGLQDVVIGIRTI
jgi:ubiquinone/menaquinone biosynthesis C-methylase UbiE